MIPLPTRCYRLLALACVCFLSESGARAAVGGTYVAGKSFLALDGVYCAPVRSWQGGEAVGDVVVENSAAGAVPKKHLGNLRYEPISVTLAFPPTGPALQVVTDFLANKTIRKNVTLTDLTYDLKPAGTPVEGVNALLVEVKFEDWDATGREPAQFTLVFAPEYVRAGTASPVPASAGVVKHIMTSGFKFRLGSWPATQVNRVAALSIKRKVATGGIGAARDYEKEATPLEFPSLVVTLAEAQSADWKLWADDFLVKGNNSDAHEKTATLELVDNLSSPVLTMQFSNVGIARLTRSPVDSGSETARRVTAELYFERMAILSTPPIASGTPVTGTATTRTPAATATPVATVAGPVAPVATTTPAATSTPGDTRSTAPVAGADLGARDPANFPRLAGLTRKTYTSTRNATLSEETATYSTTLSFDELVATYEERLKADGWEQTMRNESGDPTAGSHLFRLRWTKKWDPLESTCRHASLSIL